MRVSFLIVFLSLPGLWATAQKTVGSYYFDGDDVVFEFDRREYAKAIASADSAQVDFADLDILKVAVSGSFNHWSKEGWTMKKVDANRYRLRKPLKDFTDAPDWQFRFLINGSYWAPAEPPAKKQGVVGMYDLKNPNLPQVAPVDSGNVLFRLNGYTGSRRVILTGTFNNWDEQALHMKPVNGGWEMRLQLGFGDYEYKFIVDGKWMEDPANPLKKKNQYDTYNSILHVTKPVRFILNGYTDAQEVILAGSFNNWDKSALRMRKTKSGWEAEVPLAGGKHTYKFIIDGSWITDPANPRRENDWHGNVNSVLMVH